MRHISGPVSGGRGGGLSNELRMGGMKALFAHVFLSWAGSQLRCGARLTCTLQKFICAFILTVLEQGSFAL